jgi:predicted dehydrogenase
VTRKLGVGIVGCGNVAANFHVPAYLARAGDVRVVAAADPVPERLDAVARAAGIPADRTFAAWQDLVRVPDVDIVDICVPQRYHADVAIAAAAAGKHVLCEKPIATIPREASAMVEAAAHAGTTFAMMHNYLWFPEIAAAKRLIDAGEIGDVRLAIVNYLGVPDLPGAGGPGNAWRYDPAASGGGVLMDMLHALYVAETLLGRRALRVSAHLSATADHPRIESQALCRIEADGRAALVNVGWGEGPGGFVVQGDRGWLEARYRDGGTNPFVPVESLTVRSGGITRDVPLPPARELVPLVTEAIGAVIDDLVAAIRGRRQPLATGDDGLHTLELTIAAYAAAATGDTHGVPLDRADPLFLRGVRAIDALPAAEWSAVRRNGLFVDIP